MLKHLTYANSMATVAAFVALGGSGYAAVRLSKNSVGSAQIRNGQVKNADLARNAVTGGKVKDGSLLSADFKAGQLPAGAAGPAGPAGPKGDAGATGAQGPTGPPSTDTTTVNGQSVTPIFATVAPAAAAVQVFSGQGLTLLFSCPTSNNDQLVADGPAGAADTLVWQGNGEAGAVQGRDEAVGPASATVIATGNYGAGVAEFATAGGKVVSVTYGFDDAGSGISANCAVWGHATSG
ncbi:MAG: hypothetical protein JWM71_338 [Solirubrobacteraceae bacterium]|nr:hypothetical protein [Solirubrobacteraceae bacterium]